MFKTFLWKHTVPFHITLLENVGESRISASPYVQISNTLLLLCRLQWPVFWNILLPNKCHHQWFAEVLPVQVNFADRQNLGLQFEKQFLSDYTNIGSSVILIHWKAKPVIHFKQCEFDWSRWVKLPVCQLWQLNVKEWDDFSKMEHKTKWKCHFYP